MIVFLVIVSILAYLGVGYGWAMLFIHKITDGYWTQEGPYTGRIYRTKMGIGTAMTFTLLWPVTIVVFGMIYGSLLAADVFSSDFWKRLYRL